MERQVGAAKMRSYSGDAGKSTASFRTVFMLRMVEVGSLSAFIVGKLQTFDSLVLMRQHQ